jgi:rubrerythrin
MELLTALRPLECIEEDLAEIYEELSTRFQDDEEASRVFARLSFEERTHVQEIQFLRRVARQNPLEYAGIELELPTLLAEVEAIQRFRHQVSEASLVDALVFALKSELGAAETHARAARGQAHPVLASKLSGLSEADRRHLGLIGTFAAARGVTYEPSREQ